MQNTQSWIQKAVDSQRNLPSLSSGYSSEALSPLLWLQLSDSVPSPPGGMAQGRAYKRALLRDHALFSDGAHRKAFRESVRPGWEYLGRKMVGFPYLLGPCPLSPHDLPHSLLLQLFSCLRARRALP